MTSSIFDFRQLPTIGLVGVAGSGKDFIAQRLIQLIPNAYTQVALADALKELALLTFGDASSNALREALWGSSKLRWQSLRRVTRLNGETDEDYNNLVDSNATTYGKALIQRNFSWNVVSSVLETYRICVREVMQSDDPTVRDVCNAIGEWGRRCDPDLWLREAGFGQDKIEWGFRDRIVTDVRFTNEAIRLLAGCAEVWLVLGPEDKTANPMDSEIVNGYLDEFVTAVIDNSAQDPELLNAQLEPHIKRLTRRIGE